MNLLSVENLSKSYGAKTLFDKISFGINRGDKVALIAKNGAGKSTLINIIKGKEIGDSGNVVLRKNLVISFLDQEPDFDENKTVRESLKDIKNRISDVIEQYNLIAEKAITDHSNSTLIKLEELSRQMTDLNAWDYENKLEEILFRLNIVNLDQKIGELSGGQKKRVAVAQVLINEPELLVMDEPTNHLDVEMIEWLEHYLHTREISILLVTHDRYFLDEVCNRIVEIDNHKLYQYNGNFHYYLEKKAEREMSQAAEIDKARNLYRRELEWVRKSPRARGTKQKARTDAFYAVEEKAKQKKQDQKIDLSVKVTRLGGKILELIKLKKAWGDKVILNDFSYTFKKGEKIGIVGKNGTGKTTLLNIILGKEEIDGGKIQTGETVVYGYYSQSGMVLKEDKRVIELVKDIAEFIPLADGSKLSASQLLQKFNFPPDVQFGFVSKLSGGEKRRLYLMTILIKNPNFLILDEPTNDLDIATLQTLEDFLLDYQGCILIVSHDRYFMDKLVDHVFAFEGNGVIKDFPGSYSEYREWKEEQDEIAAIPQSKVPAPISVLENTGENPKSVAEAVEVKKKLSFKEKFELETLEKEIPVLEAEKKSLEEKMAENPAVEELTKYSKRYSELNSLLEHKTLRWLELSEGQ
jgi:ABC transport system ATP-binding/permease protein